MSVLYDGKIYTETFCKVLPDRSLTNKSKNQLVQKGLIFCGTVTFTSMELNGSLNVRDEQGGQWCIDLAWEKFLSCDLLKLV